MYPDLNKLNEWNLNDPTTNDMCHLDNMYNVTYP